MRFSDDYPEYKTIPHKDGVLYVVEMVVGGQDDEGEYLIVLDGPAEGERFYINDIGVNDGTD